MSQVQSGLRPPPLEVAESSMPTGTPYDLLTLRERETAHGLASEKTTSEIAREMGISTKTVDSHRANLLAKLKLKNNVALARFMIRIGKATP